MKKRHLAYILILSFATTACVLGFQYAVERPRAERVVADQAQQVYEDYFRTNIDPVCRPDHEACLKRNGANCEFELSMCRALNGNISGPTYSSSFGWPLAWGESGKRISDLNPYYVDFNVNGLAADAAVFFLSSIAFWLLLFTTISRSRSRTQQH